MIAISKAKKIREELGLTHLVIFGVGEDGMGYVATHGATKQQAKEAATREALRAAQRNSL